jgi:hypothetical protein
MMRIMTTSTFFAGEMPVLLRLMASGTRWNHLRTGRGMFAMTIKTGNFGQMPGSIRLNIPNHFHMALKTIINRQYWSNLSLLSRQCADRKKNDKHTP